MSRLTKLEGVGVHCRIFEVVHYSCNNCQWYHKHINECKIPLPIQKESLPKVIKNVTSQLSY
jgi:hypothetical protein